jgi:homogentisate 1,2-dioxygenase
MTVTCKNKMTGLKYLSGFGNHFESEAIEGVLPRGQNSPQKVSHGLYAEQINGTSFLMPRHQNLRSWLYRIRPSVVHGNFKQIAAGNLRSRPFTEAVSIPEQLRFDPFSFESLSRQLKKKDLDFLESLTTLCGNGDLASVRGAAVHVYAANKSMTGKYFYNSDGDFLVVPQKGCLKFATEFGALTVTPGEICVIPRGVKFTVEQENEVTQGYILENYGLPFVLPPLGVIGANGLANPRDFLSPCAGYEDKKGNFLLINKFAGNLWQAELGHCPLDVVGWHGNYAPYKYDLSLFNTVNTVSFDHPDPSIFTVLTSPSEIPGMSNIDFVIFPPRWMVAENTFRPPYYHRNIMSEFMGLVHGVYDAKQEGFVPGASSLHNAMTAHGPDYETFVKASSQELKPVYQGDTLAFMFESSLIFSPTKFALESPERQNNYLECWQKLDSNFDLGKDH